MRGVHERAQLVRRPVRAVHRQQLRARGLGYGLGSGVMHLQARPPVSQSWMQHCSGRSAAVGGCGAAAAATWTRLRVTATEWLESARARRGAVAPRCAARCERRACCGGAGARAAWAAPARSRQARAEPGFALWLPGRPGTWSASRAGCARRGCDGVRVRMRANPGRGAGAPGAGCTPRHRCAQ